MSMLSGVGKVIENLSTQVRYSEVIRCIIKRIIESGESPGENFDFDENFGKRLNFDTISTITKVTHMLRKCEGFRFCEPKIEVDISWRREVIDTISTYVRYSEAIRCIMKKTTKSDEPPVVNFAFNENLGKSGDSNLKFR